MATLNRPETPSDNARRFSPLSIAIFLTGVIVLLLLIPLPQAGRGPMAVVDSLHAPVFAIFAVVVFRGLRPWLPNNRFLSAALVWVALVVLGGVMEIVQSHVGRGMSLFDAIANALGAAAGLIWVLSRSADSRPVRSFCTATACLMILAAMAPPLSVLGDALRQRCAMPQLASFEHARELSRWSTTEAHMRRTRQHATQGSWALQVDLEKGTYPGLQMNAMPGDWTAYHELLLDITLPDGPPLDLVIKIHDLQHWKTGRATHDRFHQKVQLTSGRQTVRIALAEVRKAPRDRDMNLSQVSFLQLFTVHLPGPRTFYLDNVRLQ